MTDRDVWATCGCDHDADKHDVIADEDERGRWAWLWCRVCPGGCEDQQQMGAAHDDAKH